MSVIAVVDYGAGNLRSVKNALQFLGATATVTDDPQTILRADRVVLPGVGAFGETVEQLRKKNLVETLQTAARELPFFGICLGLQLLFPESEESPGVPGLSLFPGAVRHFASSQNTPKPQNLHEDLRSRQVKPQNLHEDLRSRQVKPQNLHEDLRSRQVKPQNFHEDLRSRQVKIPHMGWNTLEHLTRTGVFRGLPEEVSVYFVHSYCVFAEQKEIVAAQCNYYGVWFDAAIQTGQLVATQFHPEKSGELGLMILRNFCLL